MKIADMYFGNATKSNTNDILIKSITRNKYDNLHFVIRQINPFKSLQYYLDYFQFIRMIHQRDSNGQLVNPRLFKNLHRFYRIIIISHLIKIVHLLYLFFARYKMDDMWKVINADLGIFYDVNAIGQVFIIIPLLCNLVYFKWLYIQPFDLGNRIIKQILFSKKGKKNFLPPYKYFGYSAVNTVKWLSWFMANSLQFFTIVLRKFDRYGNCLNNRFHFFQDILVIYFLYYTFHYIIVNRSYFDAYLQQINPIIFYLSLFLFIILLILFGYLLSMLFAHLGILLLNLGSIAILVIFIRYWQNRQFLKSILNQHKTNRSNSLLKFLRFQRKTLILITSGNRFYGQAFLMFLLASFPINCYLMVELFINGKWSIFLFVGAQQQWICIFLLHLILAKLNSQIFSSNKPLWSLYNQKCIYIRSVRFTLYLYHFIESMLTKNRYGVSYGRFGLVSMKSFIMVSFKYFIFKNFNKFYKYSAY